MKKNPSSSSVLVSILHYGDPENTREAVLSCSGQKADILVIDNDPNNRYKPNEQIIYVKSPKNVGFAAGQNIGLRYAVEKGYDYCLLLNNDATLSKLAIEKIVDLLEQNKEYAAAESTIVKESDQNIIWFGGGKVNRLIGKASHRRINHRIETLPNTPAVEDEEYLTGCAIMIRVSTLSDIGLLDEDYFFYYEDVDWSTRAISASYKLAHLPLDLVVHSVSASTSNERMFYYDARNRLLYAKKNIRIPWLVIAYSYSSIILLMRLGLLTIRGENTSAKAIVSGVSDFLHKRYGERQ